MNSVLQIIAGGLVGAALVFAIAVTALIHRWSYGQTDSLRVLPALGRAPRAYLRDVHDVVVREPGAGITHAVVALATSASVPLVVAACWTGAPILAYLVVVCAAALLVGVARVSARRFPRRPARMSGGAYQWMPVSLGLYGVALGTLGASLAWVPSLTSGAAWLTSAGFITVSIHFLVGPFRHLIAGTTNLVTHPRPERLGAPLASGALRPADVAGAKIGADNIEDFSWRRLVNFDACVQCGRCEAACPAYAAGLPLNPKALVRQFSAALPHAPVYSGEWHPPPRFPSDPSNTIRLGPKPEAVIDPQTVWACTTCRACVYECPMLIEHLDAIVDLRRHQTLERGATPGNAPAALANLRLADNSGGHRPEERIEWATDLNLPVIQATRPVDVLLWLGDGAFQRRSQRTLRSLVRLLRTAGVDFAVLGRDELDTGDLARRLGDEATFQNLVQRNISLLARYSFRRIVTADPHVLHSLGNEYRAFGGKYQVVHHTVLLSQLLDEGKLRPQRRLPDSVTYHDPCYLARYNGETDAPRRVLDAIASNRLEMARSGRNGFCCGGGGGSALTDIAGVVRIPDMRMSQARETGAGTVAVACPNCAVMLEGVTGPRPTVSDVAELLEACL